MAYKNKVAYITGGSSGIGLGLARALVKEGAHVVLLARNAENLQKAVSSLEVFKVASDQQINYCAVDVAEREELKEAIVSAVEQFGCPDILIPCAGIAIAKRFSEIPPEEFDQLMAVNFTGTRNIIFQLLPQIEGRGGQILIVASMAGLLGAYGYTAYCASKHAQVGFAGALRFELAEKNIQVSLLCPPRGGYPAGGV